MWSLNYRLIFFNLDIDECEDEKTHRCEQVCVNLPGSFSCDCHPGYRRLGLKECQGKDALDQSNGASGQGNVTVWVRRVKIMSR